MISMKRNDLIYFINQRPEKKQSRNITTRVLGKIIKQPKLVNSPKQPKTQNIPLYTVRRLKSVNVYLFGEE